MHNNFLKKFKPCLLIVLTAFVLSACQTTVIQQKVPKFVNVVDDRQCMGDINFDNQNTHKYERVEQANICAISRVVNRERLSKVIDIAEIAYLKVAEYLEIHNPRKITLIIQNDEVGIPARAKAAIGRVYIPLRYVQNEINEGVLIHEITHALMGLSGPFVLRTEYRDRKFTRILGSSGLLNEGLATYLQLELSEGNNMLKRKVFPHTTSATLISKLRRIPPLLLALHKNQKLFQTHHNDLKRQQFTSLNYLISSSFVKYLIEQTDPGKLNVTRLYKGSTFEEIYGQDVIGVQDWWITYILKQHKDGIKNVPNGDIGTYKIGSLSNAFICRKMHIAEKFMNEAKRRFLTQEKCSHNFNLQPGT